MDEGDRVLDEFSEPARDKPLRLVTFRIEIESYGLGHGVVGFAPQNRLLDAEDGRQVVAFAHAGQELGDVRAVEPLAKQLVDGVQLRQVIVVVERRSALAPWRVEQPAFAIRADVAWADPRDARKVVESVLSQSGTPNRDGGCLLACRHCSTASAILSE